MKEAIEDVALDFEQLKQRVCELETRVSVLEGCSVQPVAALHTDLPLLERPNPPATWRGFPPTKAPAGMLAAIGKAVLGIAGAYLLRAIADSGALPRAPILVLAILYAGSWLLWGVRKYAAEKSVGFTYAATSTLILCPLVWEAVVRFNVLAPALAAVVLVGFVLASLALCWPGNIELIPFTVTFAAAVTCLLLIAGTRDFVPFSGALLSMALLAELAALSDRQRPMRRVSAVAVDLALALLLLMMVSPQGIGEGIHPASPVSVTVLYLGLLVIYGGSIGFRAFVRLFRLRFLEVMQVSLAFSIGTAALLWIGSTTGIRMLGGLFLALSVICYWGALSRFGEESYTRNRRISASWAAALVIAGSFLAFPRSVAIAFLCLLAICVSYLYSKTGKFSLGLHTTLFLGAALAASPLPGYVVSALALTVPGAPSWIVWSIAGAAALCYGVGARRLEQKRTRRVLWVVPALILGFTAAALATALLASLGGRPFATASALSVIRTAVNCILAVVLGFLCLRQQRIELGWVAYTAVGFGTLKLLFEDLRLGNALSLVISLLFYGSVLIMLPRLTRNSEE